MCMKIESGENAVLGYHLWDTNFNSSSPSAAYMRQWIGSALVQIKACRLIGAKLLSEPSVNF